MDDYTASHYEKYSLAISIGMVIVSPSHAKSLASVAIRMDTLFSEDHMSESKRRRGNCCQKIDSPLASSVSVTQQFMKNTEFIKAYMRLV